MKDLLGIGFAALSIICIAVFLRGLWLGGHKAGKGKRPFTIGLLLIVLWVVLISAGALSGFLYSFTLPPRLLIVLFIPLFGLLFFLLRGKFDGLLQAIPPAWLLSFQSFRIVVEVLLLGMVMANLMPIQMSWEGINYDVLSGIFGLAVGLWVARSSQFPQRLVFLYNIIGMGLLFTIVSIAVLSMPTPFRYFMNEPANTIVATFPFVSLPGVLVILAYTLHIASLRQWWLLRR